MKYFYSILVCMAMLLVSGCNIDASAGPETQVNETDIEMSLTLTGKDGGTLQVSLNTDGILLIQEKSEYDPGSANKDIYMKYNKEGGLDFGGFCKEYTGVSELNDDMRLLASSVSPDNGPDGAISNLWPTIWHSQYKRTFSSSERFKYAHSTFKKFYTYVTGYSRFIYKTENFKSVIYCDKNEVGHRVRYKRHKYASYHSGVDTTVKAGEYSYVECIWDKWNDPYFKVESIDDDRTSLHHAALYY